MSKNQVLIFLQGGLGNQLFQYNYGLDLRNNNKYDVKFSTLLLNLNLPGVTKRNYELQDLIDPQDFIKNFKSFFCFLMSRFTKKRVATDKSYQEIKDIKYVLGYFQDYLLVERNWDSLKKLMLESNKFKKLLTDREIESNDIGIHVRRGDYLSSDSAREYHGILNFNYYLNCVKKAALTNKFLRVKIVTDDSYNVLELINELKEIDLDSEIISRDSIEDLRELIDSSVLILSNSSFSWWAGFLSSKIHRSEIYVPDKWVAIDNSNYSRLIPPNWIKVKGEFN